MTQPSTLGQKCLAEFLGTAFLLFAGTGAVVATGYLLGSSAGGVKIADLLAIALAFGFALMVMVYAIGHISGCHLNPAVSIAFALTGRLGWGEAGAYIIAQFLGALVGVLLMSLAFPLGASKALAFGATSFAAMPVDYLQAIVLEAVGTFFLLFVIMGTAVDKRAPAGVAGLAIGLTLSALILVLGPVTGASFNPARTLAPVLIQLLSGGPYPLAHLWVYIIGPIIGAIAGVLTYDLLTGRVPALSLGDMHRDRKPSVG